MHAITNQPQTDKQIQKTFWRYTLPAVIAMLVSGLYIIIDGIFVGQYVGPSGLAGINMAWPIVYVLSALGVLIGMGSGSMVSMFRGENNPSKAKLALSSSLYLIILLGLACCAMLAVFGHASLSWQNAEGDTYLEGSRYIDIFMIAGIITVAANAIPMLIRNDDSPNLATGLLLIGAISNIGLDYLFVGVLAMGLKGAAIATIIAQTVIMLIGISYFFSRYSSLRLNLSQLKFDYKIGGRSIILGSSCLVMFLYSSFVVAIHNWLFMQYGDSITIGAFAIVGYLMSLYYLLAQASPKVCNRKPVFTMEPSSIVTLLKSLKLLLRLLLCQD
ncbi:MATE family efflux transporter [Shewanella marina]|uniref:MATE family efflux transporter n=1 Tax=Shewanella marina TaxID=487319 RepID=UPI000A6312ED|nr:MATE family efflux transporter [Shewanella marina]